MKLIRMNISVPSDIKAKLDAQRERSTTTSWFIWNLLEQYFHQARRKPAA